MKIAYFGTPDFAAKILDSLAKSGNCEITSVITQPDKRTGRKMKLDQNAVKVCAEKLNIKVKQPKNKAEIREVTRNLDVDFFVVVAYGMILEKEVLELPKIAAINVHASLLPMYRGASPIQEAILNGDKETGVSIMKMNEELDAGDVYLLKRQKIEKTDTLESLSEKLVSLSANILPIALQDIYDGELTAIPQNNEKISYCHKISKKDGEIDWEKSAEKINNMIRAYTPWPSAKTEYEGMKVKIMEAEVSEESNEPGKFIIDGKTLKIGTGKGTLIPKALQPEGKKRMDAQSFINGYSKKL